ncbi:hypothetical protein [Ciceribacter sp. T2.26MG-112.2]|uniref:hypothetical protein n=1 Tax=Ciceribacter sp. T2.26MG-112.2 TaxID=3137154 RepID=UPI0012B68FCC|nr:hypothetical protein [Ciceribacter naphthalenivorans]
MFELDRIAYIAPIFIAHLFDQREQKVVQTTSWTDARSVDGRARRIEHPFVDAAQNDLMARLSPGAYDPRAERKKLLDRYGEELCVERVELWNLGFGCGGRI